MTIWAASAAAIGAAPAIAAGSVHRRDRAHVAETGGTASGRPAASGRRRAGALRKPRRAARRDGKARALSGDYAPITANTPQPPYEGPVYVKDAAGQPVPYAAPPAPAALSAATGGSPVGVAAEAKPELLVPGSSAEEINGLAAAPMNAPAAVQEMIWAANEIIGRPYVYGGGHGSFISWGYDCSGTVSYALHGAGLITAPMDSSEMMGWGERGVGRWVTIFANPEHAYMTVAGLRLDTSPVEDPSGLEGPRWRPLRRENRGFVKRHPAGL